MTKFIIKENETGKVIAKVGTESPTSIEVVAEGYKASVIDDADGEEGE